MFSAGRVGGLLHLPVQAETPVHRIRENGMSRVCDYSGKRPQVGKRVVRRGKAKREGVSGRMSPASRSGGGNPICRRSASWTKNGRVRTSVFAPATSRRGNSRNTSRPKLKTRANNSGVQRPFAGHTTLPGALYFRTEERPRAVFRGPPRARPTSGIPHTRST